MRRAWRLLAEQLLDPLEHRVGLGVVRRALARDLEDRRERRLVLFH